MLLAHGNRPFHWGTIDPEPLSLFLSFSVAALPFSGAGGAVGGP